MMRLARRASLLVALILLAPAPTAYAECPWVLWTYDGESPSPFASKTWQVKAPFETYEQCRLDIKRHRDRAMIKEGPQAPARLHWNPEAWRIDGIDYECCPTPWTRAGRRGSSG
jgi:hypothetical protein